MNFKWMSIKVPSTKPLTTTQKALLAEIKASDTRVFDASKWNIRTINGLWQAGLIYWNCGPDTDYKQIALIKDASAPAVEESPAPAANPVSGPLPRVRAARAENAAEIMETTRRYLERNSSTAGVQSDPSSLVGCYVWAKPLDDPQYRHELHKGLITGEKKAGGIWWVHFKGDALIGEKWIPMHRIKGRAVRTEMQKAAS